MNGIVTWLRRGRGISGYAACVVGFMVLVILQGAVVRATGSGAGCGNHWPLCNGDFIPHHPRVATIIEFMHRSLTGVCTWLVIGLIAWVFLAREKGNIARRAVVWTGILLLTEGALGAVLVKGGYVESNASNMRVFVQCIHFSNTMMLLGAMTLTWWWLREREPMALEGSSRMLAWIALAATVVVGATGSVAALIKNATGVEAYFVGKPNPLMMREGLNVIGAHSESAVMVGDRMDTDVVAGMEAGMETILVLSGVTAAADIERFPYRPSRVVDSVADLISEIDPAL